MNSLIRKILEAHVNQIAQTESSQSYFYILSFMQHYSEDNKDFSHV